MKEIPIKKQPCVLCPVSGEWRLQHRCVNCDCYKGSKDSQDSDVIVCAADEI